jgi:hypothetical protein
MVWPSLTCSSQPLPPQAPYWAEEEVLDQEMTLEVCARRRARGRVRTQVLL